MVNIWVVKSFHEISPPISYEFLLLYLEFVIELVRWLFSSWTSLKTHYSLEYNYLCVKSDMKQKGE